MRRTNTAPQRLLLPAQAAIWPWSNFFGCESGPNAALLSGETPLMTAVDKGNVDAVRTLLEHEANINVKESRGGQTALMWAVADKTRKS